ncbi:hypothetical protein [Spiroplasma endosymbiont of Nebria brevicollis]|uniref:hypothetical protein n=1 Tax=Spiroplasma endosymbiont of Nebria brevicollis TaxID=3066284 RepID=UPI00313E262C
MPTTKQDPLAISTSPLIIGFLLGIKLDANFKVFPINDVIPEVVFIPKSKDSAAALNKAPVLKNTNLLFSFILLSFVASLYNKGVRSLLLLFHLAYLFFPLCNLFFIF